MGEILKWTSHEIVEKRIYLISVYKAISCLISHCLLITQLFLFALPPPYRKGAFSGSLFLFVNGLTYLSDKQNPFQLLLS
jgi:hypothetical protein